MQRWSHESRSRVCGIILAARPCQLWISLEPGTKSDRPGPHKLKKNRRGSNVNRHRCSSSAWRVKFLSDRFIRCTHVLFLNFEQFYLVLCMCALAMWLLDSHQMYEESSILENGASWSVQFSQGDFSQSVAMLKYVNFRCVLAMLVSHTGIWRTKFRWLDLCMDSLFHYQG